MSKTSNLSDEDVLIQGCIDGDTNARKALFTQYGPKLLGICARYCCNMEDAKDALQDGFVKIYAQISNFSRQSKLETWMCRIMINTAIDQFKSGLRYQLHETHDYLPDEEDEPTETIERPNAEQLLTLLLQLPEGYRTIFNLYAIEGYTHKDIAQMLGISEGTSKSQYARARAQLQKMILKADLRGQ